MFDAGFDSRRNGWGVSAGAGCIVMWCGSGYAVRGWDRAPWCVRGDDDLGFQFPRVNLNGVRKMYGMEFPLWLPSTALLTVCAIRWRRAHVRRISRRAVGYIWFSLTALIACDRAINGVFLYFAGPYSDTFLEGSAVVLLAAFVPTWFFLRPGVAKLTPTCVMCGYNLTGNASGVCPECGTMVESGGGKQAG